MISYFSEAEVLFRITPKTEHPVDLYFIMDLSKSMDTYKTSLENTATSVKEAIEKQTTKFRMGFGSFSDKPTAPFAGKFDTDLHGSTLFLFHSKDVSEFLTSKYICSDPLRSEHHVSFSLIAELSFYTGTRKAPYAYHHVQNLTTNSAEFIKSVQDQDLRGNVDSPESGMDALMQAIVCEGIIVS